APPKSDFANQAGSLVSPGSDANEVLFTAGDPQVGLSQGQAGATERVVDRPWQRNSDRRSHLKPFDKGHLLVADIETEEGIECSLRVVRRQGERPFSDEERATCRLLMPHLKRAIQLHARLDFVECERQLLAGTVSRMQVGIISFAEDGTPLETNQEASRILAERDGIWRSGNTLCVDSNQESRSLRLMIQEALGKAIASHAGGESEAAVQAMSITRPSGRARVGGGG
ncbi:MAG TPA: helix-turn-helix transcriptional regulator, partial [Gammaproteobacteria bacterium]|nr:helix-turn-helix transcriptional regulator [Gammaproteobacteria bacterium]